MVDPAKAISEAVGLLTLALEITDLSDIGRELVTDARDTLDAAVPRPSAPLDGPRAAA